MQSKKDIKKYLPIDIQERITAHEMKILIPFYFSNYDVSFIDSYFESISGLTGTGFTIFKHIKNFLFIFQLE